MLLLLLDGLNCEVLGLLPVNLTPGEREKENDTDWEGGWGEAEG